MATNKLMVFNLEWLDLKMKGRGRRKKRDKKRENKT